MRCLIIDIENLGLDTVLRLAGHGHEVRWFQHNPQGKELKDGRGFKGFQIVPDWREHMAWAKEGLILCTGNFKYLHELDRYRDLGYKIFGPTVASAKLEIERSAGMEAMKGIGLELPPYQEFNSLEEAAKFARKSDKCYVFKPMGDEQDKSLTYVSCDPADMAGWIERQIGRGKKLKGKCMLQEKIDLLGEIGVSGWFGPEGFLPNKYQVCVEHKKLMNGEIGPATGEQGTICQYVEKDKLAEEMLLPLEPVLRALGHRGDFAVGAGIDKNGKAWFFEVTARCGYPSWWIQEASHKGDPAKWMRNLLDGKDSLRVSNDVAIGVVCSIPPYPENDDPKGLADGHPIHGLDEVYDDIHCCSVMLGKGPVSKNGKIVEGPTYFTTGPYVLVATSTGKTVERARKKVYGVIDQIKMPNMQFRSDIGEKLQPVLPKLHGAGYLKNISYE